MNLFWKRLPKTNIYELEMANRHEAYNSLVRLEESQLLEEYQALTEINFKLDRKQFKNRKEYEKSPLYKKELRFKEIAEDSDIKNYLKYAKSDNLSFIKQHKQVFFEEFSGNSGLDKTQWISAFRWSDDLLHGCYSSEDEYQAYSEGKNTDVIDGQLHLTTKRKDAEGRAWTTNKGFVTKNYKFTSDVISGESHLEKTGSVIIKFRVEGAKKPLQHFIRACDDKNQRSISILETFGSKKFKVGHTERNKQGLFSKVTGKNLEKDFHILELSWTEEIMNWRLNGLLIHQDTTFPYMDHMHLLIGSKLNSPKEQEGKIIIDYIRIYGKRN